MHNKVLELTFLPQGSSKGQKITLLVKLLSQELHFTDKTNDTVGFSDWVCLVDVQ